MLVYAALAGLVIGATGAWQVQNWRAGALRAQELAEVQKMNSKRETITTGVATKFEDTREKIRVVTVTQIKEVNKYVPATDCAMSGGFRVYHDAAALGEVPDPARVPDAAPVAAQDASTVVAENYGTCRLDQEKLKGLQDWVKQHQEAK